MSAHCASNDATASRKSMTIGSFRKLFEVPLERSTLAIQGGRRYTVGDYDRLPSFMVVDEDRCEWDPTYRDAMHFLELVGEDNFCEEVFDGDKKYRDAMNLLAGRSAARESFSLPLISGILAGHEPSQSEVESESDSSIPSMIMIRQPRLRKLFDAPAVRSDWRILFFNNTDPQAVTVQYRQPRF